MTWRSSEHPCPCGLGPVHQLVALTLGTSEPAGCSVCALRLHLSGHRKWRKEGLPRLVSGVGVSLMLMPVSHESHVGIPCWLCCPGQRFLGPFGCPCSVARRSGNIFHEGARALKPEPRVPKAPPPPAPEKNVPSPLRPSGSDRAGEPSSWDGGGGWSPRSLGAGPDELRPSRPERLVLGSGPGTKHGAWAPGGTTLAACDSHPSRCHPCRLSGATWWPLLYHFLWSSCETGMGGDLATATVTQFQGAGSIGWVVPGCDQAMAAKSLPGG